MSPLTKIDVATWTAEEHRQVRCQCGAFAVGDTDSNDRLLLRVASVATEEPFVRVTNLGPACELAWHGRTLSKHETATLALPAHVVLAENHLEIRQPDWLTSLGYPLRTIERPREPQGRPLVPVERLGSSPGSETLSKWFAALEALHYDSAGSPTFFAAAAKAVTNPGGMTGGLVVLREDDAWQIVGSHVPDPRMGISFCQDLLELVFSDRRTRYRDSSSEKDQLADAVVAAPVFHPQNGVVGAVYGYRSWRNQNRRRGIRAFEALWIQLVAGSIRAALARQAAEAEIARKTVLLEQTFAPEVIREIMHNRSALDGQEKETTILFVDLRESAAISERLDTKDNYRLLSAVLETLTQQVMDNSGVIIDYYGDGLAAMWNAPTDQPDHARLACGAALGMVREVEKLNKHWSDRLGQSLEIGVGISTGICRIGNSGTRLRLKYGPRGKTVALASRLESATKQVRTPILLSEATVQQLGTNCATRRVCRALLPGIAGPVHLYELCALDVRSVATELFEFIARYERAVELYEAGELAAAENLLTDCHRSQAARRFPAEFLLQVVRERRQGDRRSVRRAPADRRQPPGIVDLASPDYEDGETHRPGI